MAELLTGSSQYLFLAKLMNIQIAPLQADFAAAAARWQASQCPVRLPGGWVRGLFAVCAWLAFAASSAFAQGYQWSNFVGKPGGPGAVDGSGTAARFYYPKGVAVDSSGSTYVADQNNHTIRKVTADGVVTTLAGRAGVSGSSDGTGDTARFHFPAGVAVDASMNVYVADQNNQTIRKVTPAGVVTTLAGLAGSYGNSNGTGSGARFSFPCGVAVDGSGNVYVADSSNNTIRKVTPGGVVTTLAGLAGSVGSSDGVGSSARFSYPTGVAVDDSGNVYVADSSNNTIRKVTPGGVVTTLAGLAGSVGSSDGVGSSAQFWFPTGVAVDGSGNAYVADSNNNTLRKVTPDGLVTTLAGLAGSIFSSYAGSSDGPAATARFNLPTSVAVDGSGNLYVADAANHSLRKMTAGGVVSTLAGPAGSAGSSDGTGTAAQFMQLQGAAVDGSGNLYVADSNNHTIRKVTPAGVVTTLAGRAGNSGNTDGTGSAALFNAPHGVAVDGSGNVYVADTLGSTIRKVTPGGVVTTLAGSGVSGSIDGTGTNAQFFSPSGVAVDGSGNVYVADTGNNLIRKVTSAGVVTTIAGGGSGGGSGGGIIIVGGGGGGSGSGSGGSNDGTGTAAKFQQPQGVAVDGSGNVYVADTGNHTLRKISPSGVVTTIAGTAGVRGSSPALFNSPQGVAVDGSGNVYVADTGNHTLRILMPSGVVSTAGGTPGVQGWADGLGAAAGFDGPCGIAVSGTGTVYVADTLNNRVSKGVLITAPPSTVTVSANVTSATQATLNGLVNANWFSTAASFDFGPTTAYGTHVAATPTPVTGGSATAVSAVINGLSLGATYHFRVNGTSSGGTSSGADQTFTVNMYGWTNFVGTPGGDGYADGTGANARFSVPAGVAVDGGGNIYVADSSNSVIRKVTPGGVVTTLAGLAGSYGSSDGTGSAARFNAPRSVAVDTSGNVYVADQNNQTIRKVTPAGVVTTLAGLVGTSGSNDGTGSGARFYFPCGVAVDGNGNVYVADGSNQTIRKVTPAGVVSTLAGFAGSSGSSDGTGSGARFYYPYGVAVDGSGNVYVADSNNHTLRKVTPGGVVSTLAGFAGSSGSSDGTGTAARFCSPASVTVDGSGNVYVADAGNQSLRKVTPGGVVTTLAGPVSSRGSDDGTGSAAQFIQPQGLAMDGSGNLYVADTGNHTLRKVTPGGVVSTLAGSAGSPGSSDGIGRAALFNTPTGVAVDGSGNVYVADQNNHTVRKVTPGGMVSTLAGLAGSYGSSDGTGSGARFKYPAAVAVDGSGNVYVADQSNHTIRKVTPAGLVTTLLGSAGVSGSSDGTGSAARFYFPCGVTVDGSGNLYVADTNNNTIRQATPAGVVTTLAGLAGSYGSSDGIGSAARLHAPRGMAVDGSGNVYVADQINSVIRRVTRDAVVSTIGGTAPAIGWVDGQSGAAGFNWPQGIAVSSTGVVYVADTNNNRISVGVILAAPLAVTAGANIITSTGATLNGTICANGLSTAVSFDYGLTTAYGTNVASTPMSVTGGNPVPVGAVIQGLTPGTVYHFRVNGTNGQGTLHGSDQTFTTASTPSSWRQQWFSTTGNTGTAADSADPYHTGVPNLVAFALLGPSQNPAAVRASQLPQPQAAGGNFVYSFTEPAGVSGITYGAQYSTSLNPANWQPVTDSGSGTQHVFSIPIGGSTQVFMRLTLTNIGP